MLVGWRWELTDREGAIVESLPAARAAGSVSWDAGLPVQRQATGLVLEPGEWEQIDVVSNRVRLYLQVDGAEFPAGRFMLGNPTRERRAPGRAALIVPNLFELTQLLNVSKGRSQQVPAGTTVGDAVRLLLASEQELADDADVDVLAGEVGAAIIEPAEVPPLVVVNDLVGQFGGWPLHTTGEGRARIVPQVDPDEVEPVVRYDEAPASGWVAAGTVVESDEVALAPNLYVAVGADGVTGRYEIPVEAPHSIVARQSVFAEVVQAPTATSVEAATRAAQAASLADPQQWRTLRFATLPTRIPDPYEVIRFDDENWRLESWHIDLAADLPLIEQVAVRRL